MSMPKNSEDFKPEPLVSKDDYNRIIEDDGDKGNKIDKFGNQIYWESDPDCGLIKISVNNEEVVTWCYEESAENIFLEFMGVWNKAQDCTQEVKK